MTLIYPPKNTFLGRYSSTINVFCFGLFPLVDQVIFTYWLGIPSENEEDSCLNPCVRVPRWNDLRLNVWWCEIAELLLILESELFCWKQLELLFPRFRAIMSVTLRKAELLRPSPRTWNKGSPPWVKMAYLWNNQLADWCNHCKYNDKDENKGDDNNTVKDSDKDKGQGQGKSSLAELICEITSWQIDATIAQSRSASPTNRHNVHHNHCRAVTVCRKVTFATNHPQCGFHTQLLQQLHKGFGAKGKAFVFQAWFHFWNWTCPYLGGRRSHKKWEQSLEITLTLARINQSLDRIG